MQKLVNATHSPVDFYNDLQRALRRVSERHGYKVPEFSCTEVDGSLFCSISFLSADPLLLYKHWYLACAPALGLEPKWLGATFQNTENSMTLELLGLDPCGGEFCIRVADKRGQHYHLHPQALRELIGG